MIERLNHREIKIAGEIQRIQQPAYQIEADLMGFQGIPQLAESVKEIQSSNEIFIGFGEEEIKGFISYTEEEGLIDISRLVVHPVHFRQGIARKLLDFLVEQYPAHEFMVSTGTANEPAKNLYRTFGFIEQEEFEVAPGVACTNFRKID